MNDNERTLMPRIDGEGQGPTDHQMQDLLEQECFMEALKEGIKDLEENNVRPAEEVFRRIMHKT